MKLMSVQQCLVTKQIIMLVYKLLRCVLNYDAMPFLY